MKEGQEFCTTANPEIKYTCIGSGECSTIYGKAEDGTIVPFHSSEITEYPTKAATGAQLCPVGTAIQTLIFSKENFTKKQAQDWTTKHDFMYGIVDEKENTYRIRQRDPSYFTENSFRTITLTDGIKAVIGCPDKAGTGAAYWIASTGPSKLAAKGAQVEVKLTSEGEDYWSRELFKGSDGVMYVEVDGVIHDMTSEGEPIAPVRGKNFIWPEYMVFNYTDNIYASGDTYKTKKEANDFIKSFRKRFEKQGYYRDNRMQKIPLDQIDLLAIPADFSPFRAKEAAKGGKVGEEVYIDFLNKKKGFQQDRKYFDSYEKAVAWAQKNFERFDPDMIKYSMENGGKVEFKTAAHGAKTAPMHKNWEVKYLTFQGTAVKKTIRLGRLSDKFDVQQQLKRMGLNIREVLYIKEVASHGKKIENLKVGDVVFHKQHNTIGIVRDTYPGEEYLGEVRTDSDGNVSVSELEIYDPSDSRHAQAHIAPSTRKELGMDTAAHGTVVRGSNVSASDLEVRMDAALDPVSRAAQGKPYGIWIDKSKDWLRLSPDGEYYGDYGQRLYFKTEEEAHKVITRIKKLEQQTATAAHGGRIKDRKYTSSQPHEKRYKLKRKSPVIKYKKK